MKNRAKVLGNTALLWLILALVFFACSDATSPESFRPRVLHVEARSCVLPQASFRSCQQTSTSFDPAGEPPRDEFIWFVASYQNPVDPAWELWRIELNGKVSGETLMPLGQPQPNTHVVVGDTIMLGTISRSTPTFTLRVILASGEDKRSLTFEADTSFTWRQPEAPPEPEGI